MTQTAVANLECGLGYIALSGTEQFRGAFESNLPNELLDRDSDLSRELPAQIERAAPELPT